MEGILPLTELSAKLAKLSGHTDVWSAYEESDLVPLRLGAVGQGFQYWVPIQQGVLQELLSNIKHHNQGWAEAVESELRAALGAREILTQLFEKILAVETILDSVTRKLDELRTAKTCLWVPIDSFGPEPYEIVKPITAVVVPSDEGFEASFFPANLHAWGETEEEAISTLKEVLIDTSVRLNELSDDQLGPEPQRQKATLMAYIRPS